MGYDAGKKVKGRKIHALVDTEGLPLRVVVHSAAIQDRDGAALVFDRIRQRFNRLELIWPMAATTPAKSNASWPPSRRCGWRSSNVPTAVQDLSSCRAGGSLNGPFLVRPKPPPGQGPKPPLAKDYENLADTLAAFISLACIRLALSRLART